MCGDGIQRADLTAGDGEGGLATSSFSGVFIPAAGGWQGDVGEAWWPPPVISLPVVRLPRPWWVVGGGGVGAGPEFRRNWVLGSMAASPYLLDEFCVGRSQALCWAAGRVFVGGGELPRSESVFPFLRERKSGGGGGGEDYSQVGLACFVSADTR